MPQSTHDRVAELHNLTQHAHDKAATSHDQNDHLSAHEQTEQASEESRNATHHAQSLKHGKELSDEVAADAQRSKP